MKPNNLILSNKQLRSILPILTIALAIPAVLALATYYHGETAQADLINSYNQNRGNSPIPPQPLGSSRVAPPQTLSEEEKKFILNKVSDDRLVNALINKGGLKRIGTGIILVDNKGLKIGGCAGVMLKNPIWINIEYKSIFGGIEKYNGLTDNIIVCVNTVQGSIIGYYIEPKSLIVRNISDIQKENLDSEVALKLSQALNYVEDYILKIYGIKPVKYKIGCAKNGILVVTAYIEEVDVDAKNGIDEIKVVVFRFNFDNLRLISINEDKVIVVNSNVIMSSDSN